jgi:hypothetical protein
MAASKEILTGDAFLDTFYRQRNMALVCRADYAVFEKGEGGAEWSRRDLIDGGLGNAWEFSEGLRTGDEECIREGHDDFLWTAYVLERAYGSNPAALAHRYATAQSELLTGNPMARDLTAIRANLLESACALPRFAAVLDGRRTLPEAAQHFERHLGDAVYYLTLAVPVANQVYGLSIDPVDSFEQHMKALSVRIALQITYSQLRDGLLQEREARERADQLARSGLSQGIGAAALAAIWEKAPTRVRDMSQRGFPVPYSF